MSEKQQPHRPGPFKIPSKRHKTGQHRSKGAVLRDAKGKLGVKVQSFKQNRRMSRADRKNQIQQLRNHKRDKISVAERMEGGANRAPFLTTVISFDELNDSGAIIKKLLTSDPDSSFSESKWGRSFNLEVKRFKSSYSFVSPNEKSMNEVLDCVKVSDVLILVWPLSESITAGQELLITSLLAMGIPTAIQVVCGMPPNGKQRDQMRKIIAKSTKRWGMADDKLHTLDNEGDGLQILRLISAVKKSPTILQRRRPHLLVDQLDTIKGKEPGLCTLKVSGYARGPPFSVNRMVHIQGWGDFRLSNIDIREDSRQKSKILERCTDEQTGAAKQTSMTIDDAEMEISDEEDEEESDAQNGDGGDDIESQEDDRMTLASAMDDDSSLNYTDENKINMEEVEKYRQERENVKWPDEIDTPNDRAARERFQKYRGLKSFRTSQWDPKENLPTDYAKIYKFSNFKHTKKVALNDIKKSYELSSEDSTSHSLPGSYVTLHIAGVPSDISAHLKEETPLVIFQMLAHEEKMSLLNMVLQKHPSCRVPIKNKQKLIFQVGYRKFSAEPLLSEHTNGSKFKMHRFMPEEGTFCASVFAPVMFPPASVLVFQYDQRGRQKLVATGTVLDLNPDRICLKRVILSGHPYRINKRVAVVRYMFFNKEDVDWFKPIQLYTPKGRRGHIKESLGVHGLLKCLFDQPLTTQDAVMMNLYKRVFPKWTYNPRVAMPAKLISGTSSANLEEVDEQMEE